MIQNYIGIDSDYIIVGLAALSVLLFVMVIINTVQMSKLKKKYKAFMDGKNAKTLEEAIMNYMEKIEIISASAEKNRADIDMIFKNMKHTFQKVGLVKYDAFHEMGGKLSFSLTLLNERNDGFIINAMHSREGCYTYIKEIIDGNSIIALSEEEKEALDMAMNFKE